MDSKKGKSSKQKV